MTRRYSTAQQKQVGVDPPRFTAMTLATAHQGCSGAGTRWNAVPANILEPERRSGKYRWPQVER